MGNVNYEPVIRDMTWSYSRIKAFEDCPYRWYLKYIRRLKGKDMFFSSYGSFVHKLLELYYKGEKTQKQLCEMYLQDFKNEVVGFAPNKMVFVNYFKSGLDYFRAFQPLPFRPLAIEKEVSFKVEDIPFVGYIDLLGEKDGDIYVIDNKSRNLKPRTGRNIPTKTDIELDHYLRQLYLYSVPVAEEYGKYPKSLCFNCFRTPILIEDLFKEDAYEESKAWLRKMVDTIKAETDFKPSMDFFKCNHLCEMNDFCEYYEMSQKKRGDYYQS